MRNHSTLETIAPRNFSLESGLYVNHSVPCTLNSKCQLKPYHNATSFQPLQVPPMFRFHADLHFLWYSATAHHFSVGLFSRSVYYFFWRRVIFILNSALPSILDTPPHTFSAQHLFTTLHSRACKHSYYYADCSRSAKAGFVCSSCCSW